jgi:hypothetical protein
MLDYPRVFFLVSVLVLWLSAQVGVWMCRRWPLGDHERKDFEVVQTATLTMLGLIIGFSFSMAIVRYDLRKSDEAAEANAIGTEYFRLGLLPRVTKEVRAQLRSYLGLRIAYYQARDEGTIPRISADTEKLQADMWHSITGPALAQQTPIIGLAVSGMNDVLNSQGYSQAAWWNRIPMAAWVLMAAIAIGCNLLVGYGARTVGPKSGLPLILPLMVSTAFLLIADIDSPRHGFIHVVPDNLISLTTSLPGQ